MQLSLSALQDRAAWERMGIALPQYDVSAVAQATREMPRWLHFGAGNIFRAYVARLQHDLLNAGLTNEGIIAAETFDAEILSSSYLPYDNLALLVSMHADGHTDRSVLASVTETVTSLTDAGIARLKAIAAAPSLQMISFTITEKGYTAKDPLGNPVPDIIHDITNGPLRPTSAMGIATALLLERYNNGGDPIALVSLDNCSHNGEKLQAAITTIATAWIVSGFAKEGFMYYLSEPSRVSFPWTMIDKITPRPDSRVQEHLTELGLVDMDILVTGQGTFIAPFVNAESSEYLVIEDEFPNGRPPLEQAGVYMTDRETVNRTERMKVCTCLNPLHTGMAVFGCLLRFPSIAASMRDPDIRALVERIGAVEGMPVVTDPGIIKPMEFLREVIDERLSNPYIPDTPERIVVDHSAKVAIRFGETLKSYAEFPDLDVKSLVAIPLAIAGWMRYLVGVDDDGRPLTISFDPYAADVQAHLAGIQFGQPGSYNGQLTQVLNNVQLFGVDLYSIGLGEKIESLFIKMLEGPGAVRSTLHEALN
ncbi:mannitol dehydrogenase [Clostridia bacterium]|nr:mannitol dehydrogenase [Clostridia bacterium]